MANRDTLPFTSADFDLQRKHAPSTSSYEVKDHEVTDTTELQLLQMRWDAFEDLHKSVADSQEGLVRRMRDWESARCRPGPYARAKELREHRRSASLSGHVSETPVDVTDEDADDEVEFVGETTLSYDRSSTPDSVNGRLSAAMDLDYPGFDEAHISISANDPAHRRQRSSSSSASPASSTLLTPALCPVTGGESLSVPALSLPPSVSITQPPVHGHHRRMADGCGHGGNAFSDIVTPPSTASRSDKAVAAITLALASGAGGLNDYSPLQNLIPSGNSSEDAGDLWH
jgi:hypothetical protein